MTDTDFDREFYNIEAEDLARDDVGSSRRASTLNDQKRMPARTPPAGRIVADMPCRCTGKVTHILFEHFWDSLNRPTGYVEDDNES